MTTGAELGPWLIDPGVDPFEKDLYAHLRQESNTWIASVSKSDCDPGDDVACITRYLPLGFLNVWFGKFKPHLVDARPESLEYVAVTHFRHKLFGVNLVFKIHPAVSLFLIAAAAIAAGLSATKYLESYFGGSFAGLIAGIVATILAVITQEEGTWEADDGGGDLDKYLDR